MPPKKSNLNNERSREARRKRVERAHKSAEQITTRNAAQRIRTAEGCAQESQEQHEERLRQTITRTRAARERNIAAARVQQRQRQQTSRSLIRASFVRLAFEYAPDINYSAHPKIGIGAMDKVCQYCQALKFRNETPGMCCASGKVVLSPLPTPPEPLLSLLAGESDDSKLFLRKIRKFNSCFQMTSFGATKICDIASNGRNFETTFKVQGQVYHKIGSLLPMPDDDPKFLQIYFMGNCEERVTTRCQYNFIDQAQERKIVLLLENFLDDQNQLIRLFKRVSPRLQNDNYQIVIKADKVPLGEHAGRFNAPTVDEVAVIMVGDPVDRRAIKITRRDNTVSTISDLHRSYDALQYPLIFWQGQDEYHLNIKQCNPNTGAEGDKKTSSMNYYAHRLMVRLNQNNYILRYRQLFHQYIVDMYAKVESERLRFIRYNQAKLRSEEYIHLRDAVVGNIDGNLNPNDIGNAFILPSSYIGSPRNMQEYIQDAMTYVRHYGRPDLFITFTFFGITRCWLYSIEWQKRGLPHAHILIWLQDKIRSEEIDQIISAEIPGPSIDQKLFDIVTKHMIYGPCGALNMTSPCMENGKCKKNFPKPYTNDTITDIDGYPMYRRRNTDNGGHTFTMRLPNFTNQVEFDNQWVVPYSPLLSKTYEAHINVELCSSTLIYSDVPRYFTWNKSGKKWEPRKQGKPHPSITGIFKAKTLGRLYTVHPKQRECFYLRLLLVNVPGPTSFEFLRTFNGRVFNTYQDACRELHLLEDDNHWDLTLADAALTSTPNNIRQLFAIVLTTCYPSQAQFLWEKYKNCMTEDILHRIRQTDQCQNIDYTPQMYNEALVLIEDLCVLISNLPLNHYGMPSPDRPATDLVNTDLQREKQYDHGILATIIGNSEPLLTAEQKIIYDRIMLTVADEQGGFFFLGRTRVEPTQQQGQEQVEEPLTAYAAVRLMPNRDPVQASLLSDGLDRPSWLQYHLFGMIPHPRYHFRCHL
ncbi:uncharacterized protein LOC129956714 [Argiope bruennichi]|uniref:uncharacterized protein LOC129956714 n=1 Tax=Argiope bruennichi TaxID=94029 RepID=UPI00249438CF|nr:uncharacterized protein LOC129956714 [Argiope bruennichi]